MAPEPGGPGGRPESFDDTALDYDAFRPPYPPEVVQLVVSSGNIDGGSRVLEIACGTGQLSVDLARRGCELVAVEMGPHLARLARRNLAAFPWADVDVARFEEWPLPAARFDVVVCASALHWIAPGVRLAKPAEALRPGGRLVIVHVHHVGGGTSGLTEDTQPIYGAWGLSDATYEPPSASDLPPMYPELDLMAEYGPVQRHRLEIPRAFTTATYVGWLRTDSLVLGLGPEEREGFLHDIATLIDSRYHGRVSRNFVYEVIAARRA